MCIRDRLYSCKAKQDLEYPKESPYTFDFVSARSIVELSDIALDNDKLVFIDVYAQWCMPCKMMDEDVFKDKKLGDFFNENFISYRADGETNAGADIAELYKVLGYPTLLFLDSNGQLLVKKTGVAYSREMYDLAEEALAMRNHQEGE